MTDSSASSNSPQTNPRVLIVDDDREIRDLLSQFLQKHGYEASTVAEGKEMQQALADSAYDLIVLDLMLPGEDGLTLCRQLRASSAIPIIMLTAVGEDMDRIIGLEMGADDYVTKPFNPRELLARIKAVLRRNDLIQQQVEQQHSQHYSQHQSPSNPAQYPQQNIVSNEIASPPCFQFGRWVLDVGKRELRTHDLDPVVTTSASDAAHPASHPDSGTLVLLTAGEFDLLLAFVEHPQRVLSRDQLLDYTKGYGAMSFDRSIDVQLSRLRRKIEDKPKAPVLIKTIRGGGYMFTPKVTLMKPSK